MTGTTPRLRLEGETVAVGEGVTGRLLDAGPGVTVTIELLWRTVGPHETEEKVVARTDVETGESGEGSFRLEVPSGGPMSYAGKSFSITWFVRLAGAQPTARAVSVIAAVKAPETNPTP